MIAAGGELTKRLQADKDFGLLCSLWLYTSESSRWKLVVASPRVETDGPLHAYHVIQGILGHDWPADLEIPLYTISVMRSNHPLVSALRSLGHFEIQDFPRGPRPSPTVRVGKRISFTRVQDTFIEDALIYFIK